MLGIILVIIVSIFGMTMLFMATGNDTYIDRNSERGRVLNDYTETFQEENWFCYFNVMIRQVRNSYLN
jgi:predicted RND superfamily exporter protein